MWLFFAGLFLWAILLALIAVFLWNAFKFMVLLAIFIRTGERLTWEEVLGE